ncbi:hypothetical protein [Corynebacterium minutissimum]|uniref:Uncharacterized protein n=1 Tax=Corynebacterium minutissimum TaxID=38301 RepID=A0A2X4RFM5_9CORY|nr:hypothetical protein [Corynebacterium minutissimum]QPS60140.1 hypothetical protein I6G51_02740 [Corynebacterium minutissimum]QQA79070.1 hypothetical protein I6H49_10105 [Corynebacterium minutissimum]SQI01036.1 Uncharacterised protein [Corynebacterium minutissimum]VEG04897.1 Uncharacterised protein [Corynebacterium minutissimum]
MTVTNYVVPHEGFGDPRRLNVNNVDPDLFLSLLDEEGDDHQLTVTLCGHSSSGFRVRHEDTVVGMISAEQSEEYSELDWVMSSGLSPQVTATVCLNTDSDDDTTPVFEVLLPEPGLCVPSNNPPAERWGLLEGDTALHVTDFDATHEALPGQSAHLLIRVDNKRGLAHRHIELSLDNVLIATIPRGEAKWLADSIAAVNDDGLVAVSRAYYSAECDAPTLTIFAGHDAPTGIPALRTAGVVAAATTAGTPAAIVHSEAHGATSSAPFIGTSAGSESPTISLSSLDGASPKAGFGAKLAGASTGLKLACAASVAIIIGGTANFAASVVSLSSSHELVTGSALEAYEDPLISPRAAGAQDADEAEATKGSDAPESQEKYVTQDMTQGRFWDAPSRLLDDEPGTLDGSSDAGPAAAMANEAPSESTAAGRAGEHHEATTPPKQPQHTDAAPKHRPSPSNRTRSTSNSDSSPLRLAERDTAASGSTQSRQVKPKPRPTTPKAAPTAAAAPTTPNADTPPRTKPQTAPTSTTPPTQRPTYLPGSHPADKPRTPRPTPPAPIGQDRAAVGEDRSPIGQDRSAMDHDRAIAGQEHSPRIEDLIIVPFLPFLPPELLEPLPGTTPDIPQEPTPEAETESTAPQEPTEPTDPAPVTETEPSATSEAELEPKDELAVEDEPSVEPSTTPSAEPSIEPLPEPEATEPTPSPEEREERGAQDERDEREKNKRNSHIPPGQLKKMERENGPAPVLRNR